MTYPTTAKENTSIYELGEIFGDFLETNISGDLDQLRDNLSFFLDEYSEMKIPSTLFDVVAMHCNGYFTVTLSSGQDSFSIEEDCLVDGDRNLIEIDSIQGIQVLREMLWSRLLQERENIGVKDTVNSVRTETTTQTMALSLFTENRDATKAFQDFVEKNGASHAAFQTQVQAEKQEIPSDELKDKIAADIKEFGIPRGADKTALSNVYKFGVTKMSQENEGVRKNSTEIQDYYVEMTNFEVFTSKQVPTKKKDLLKIPMQDLQKVNCEILTYVLSQDAALRKSYTLETALDAMEKPQGRGLLKSALILFAGIALSQGFGLANEQYGKQAKVHLKAFQKKGITHLRDTFGLHKASLLSPQNTSKTNQKITTKKKMIKETEAPKNKQIKPEMNTADIETVQRVASLK